jgi:hypothetical protein
VLPLLLRAASSAAKPPDGGDCCPSGLPYTPAAAGANAALPAAVWGLLAVGVTAGGVLALSSAGSQGLLPAGEDCADAGCSRRPDRGVPHALEGCDSRTVVRRLCGLKPGAGDAWTSSSSGREQCRTVEQPRVRQQYTHAVDRQQ